MEHDASVTSTPDSRRSQSHEVEDNADIEKLSTQQIAEPDGHKIAKATTAQDWSGPDDPENPHNWPLWTRIYHTASVGCLLLASTFGTSVYTPGVFSVQKDFNVSATAALLPLSLYTIGLGLGPVMGAPISETLGRKAVYLFTFPPALLFTMGSGLAQNFGTLLICRFLAGMFSSPCLAVGAGSNSDVWPPFERAIASAFFLFAPFAGPAIGPVIGGFCVQRWDWRWTQWAILIVGGTAYLFSLFQKETYKKIILQRRAKRLNIAPPLQNLPTSPLAKLKLILMITIGRPLVMLFTEPLVSLFSIYTAFNFSVLFCFFAAFPIVFAGTYNFNLGETGLTFLGIGLGCFIAVACFIVIDRITYRKRTLAARAKGDFSPPPPEERLYPAMLGSLLLPVGLFWFAWTARSSVHWISPILATVPFACGNLLVFCSCMLYLIDTYGPISGASAAAANGVLRYAAGAGFPLFTRQMYMKLGIDWATSLLGFVTVALLPIPWMFFRYGERLRARSAYQTFGK